MKKRKIHAFTGGTGAGKTTISKQFSKEIGAYRISHDELLSLVYDQDQLVRDHLKCCKRANNLAWKIVEQVTSLGVDVVMEGWGSRELRDQIRKNADEFYLVSCPQEERLKRIRKRNKQTSEDAPYISDEDFYRIEKIENDFGDEEAYTVIDNKEYNNAQH